MFRHHNCSPCLKDTPREPNEVGEQEKIAHLHKLTYLIENNANCSLE